ncbi:MAG: trypsin-like serine protease, partial [Pseudomonadota bacterium]
PMAGLEGVGRLDIRGYGFCTAALVTPTLVLTAAHCLYDDKTGTPHVIERMRFRAGLSHGASVANRGIRRMIVDPGYVHMSKVDLDNVAHDLALLELETALDLPEVRPFPAAGRLGRGDQVQLVSYGENRAEAPQLEHGCSVLERNMAVLLLDCSVEFGSSGAPVFISTFTGPQIVSVISAMSETSDGTRLAIAVTVEDGLKRLEAEFARSPALSPGAKRLRGTGTDRGTIRFLRPDN